MSIKKADFFRYIKQFELKELFIELGWNRVKLSYPVAIDEQSYSLVGIAEKKNFVIFLCESSQGKNIPDSAVRRKIDNVIAKLHHEHLIIYTDGNKTRQRWELLIREENKPVVCRPVDYYKGQEPELLFQKLEGLFFEFDDEDKLTIVDVRSRVLQNFERNAETVTKKFYDGFGKEHDKFIAFIKGIESKMDREWYASLMLNRLMFIYFIQKKGFLDQDKDYLRTRLTIVQKKRGKNKFYSFYRDFLLVLFHKGLGAPSRPSELEQEIGKVPYLNGGLFDVHELEKGNEIFIEDKAFERLFDFFDQWNWHLDTRVTATGKDINPDVIGYIFEKYINDRAAMGAYYTKEDITEYISKNCIVPWLFDEVKRNYPKPFVGRFSESTKSDSESRSTIWSFLQHSGNTYIYPAVKHGIRPDTTEQTGFDDLPEDVRACIDPNTPDLVEKRKCWNRQAPPEVALPTEIYREVIARRKRYYEVRKKIEAGEITEINDFITYNLNIRQFAQDLLRETDDAKLVMEFYKAVRKITVLDPTCGSGAFLFAALNVLEPLYFTCVTRMRDFVEEDGKGRHKFFEEELKRIDADDHPNTEYFVYKSIILHNLYGVDIMKEAVEIAKLRLFLKLVATVDVDYTKPNLGLEPLPDIDFNIRSGNTLVGYATLADLDKGKQISMFGDKEKDEIREQMEMVAKAYEHFKDEQNRTVNNPVSYKNAKAVLEARLKVLNERLNKHLAVAYLGSNHGVRAFSDWCDSHKPFHWLAEYYTTMTQGGFNTIVGNPPYIEYSKVRDEYSILDYRTETCGNLYANVIERCFSIQSQGDRFGVIVQLPIVCTDRMSPLQKECIDQSSTLWFSNFDDRPGKLFDGLQHIRASIVLAQKDARENQNVYATTYNRWYTEVRVGLFHLLSFQRVSEHIVPGAIPKIGSTLGKSIQTRLEKFTPLRNYLRNSSSHKVYFHNAPQYWIRAMTFIPYFWNERDGEQISTQVKGLNLPDKQSAEVVAAILNSTIFYWWFLVLSDCRHLNLREIENFPTQLDQITETWSGELQRLAATLMSDLKKHKQRKTTEYKTTGSVEYDEFYPRYSKPIIDEIDKVLAKHYGFSEEELDFIINYDIKYRMGKELSDDGE